MSQMEEGHGQFAYDTLPAGHRRLLTITDSEAEGLLKCTLETHPIAAIPRYAALSYAWGSNDRDKAIICNGQRMLVTTSVFEALTSLKKYLMDGNLPIWIDAVCINQADEAEKCRQIRHMDQVYQSAEVTIIWLGMVLHDDEEGIHAIPSLAEKFQRISSQTTIQWLQFEDHGLPEGPDQVWMSLIHLFCRPWFYRVWTFQEAVLAKHIIFACGPHIIGWTDLYAVAKRLLDSDLPVFLGCYHGLFELTQIGEAKARYISAAAGEHEAAAISTLGALLLSSKRRHCFNPRDRIYGLLSLVPRELRSQVPVSYTMDLGVLSQECGKICLRGSGRLEYLRARARYARSPTLPSWCLDLNLPPWKSNTTRQETHNTSSDKTAPPACQVSLPSPAEVRMAMSMFRLDEIDNVSSRTCMSSLAVLDVPEDMRLALEFLDEGLLLARKKYSKYLLPPAHVRAAMQVQAAEYTARQLRQLYEEGVRVMEIASSKSTLEGAIDGGSGIHDSEPEKRIRLWAEMQKYRGCVYITTACGNVGISTPEVRVGD
ncbi:heterokaryon incompatibility protein-domain-containing protein [Podospora appendiculata]|uniref:Heterokaryon incompatibility protein-domain-containing protein n=1 Tax=Podospora appendiculata TaxID=314037 RepID=A0AAE0X6V2_9PEZI|nr:heterokaryon incompatibility protein-domain-containing protein [Podospora appendiculata]